MLKDLDPLALVDRLLDLAHADAVTVSVHAEVDACTRFADNLITQNVARTNASVSVACAFGNSHGSAATNDLTDEGLAAVVRRAAAAARLSPPDPEYMPPVPPDDISPYPEVDAWDDATAACTPAERTEPVAAAVARVARAGYRLSGAMSSVASLSAFGNSRGLRTAFRSTAADVHVTVLGNNGSGWAQRTASAIADVAVSDAVEDALQTAARAQNPVTVKPGRYTVILPPAAVANLVPHTMICDAKASDEGRTFLRGRLGQQICSPAITIRSDPADPRCPGCSYGADGLPQHPVDWIKNGRLETLATSRYWAAKTGRRPIPYPSTIIMDPGAAALDDMVARTEHGILVTRLWYIRNVDHMRSLVTGMTRDGTFLVEQGRIVRPIVCLRFNQSILDMLNSVDELGQARRVGNAFVPVMKVRNFNITSVTLF